MVFEVISDFQPLPPYYKSEDLGIKMNKEGIANSLFDNHRIQICGEQVEKDAPL
jgi:hypothetical protein